ncbi:MAG: hypothetical protein WDA03_07820 [Trueperaceae bacterium]
MKRLLLQVVAATVMVALLAACASPADGRMMVRLDPVGNLGYEVSGGNITVETRSLVFRNFPGEPVAAITGVEAAFYSSNGVIAEMWIAEPNSLNIVVPAGFTCTEPDPLTGCTGLSAGAMQDFGMPSVVDEGMLQLLPVAVVQAHLASPLGSSSWWGEFTFHGNNAYGAFQFTRPFYITAPN